MTKKLILTFIWLFTLISLYAQTTTHEADNKVPALSGFHDVIYPIWHTYYPEKKYAELRNMRPMVEEAAAKIYAVVLPEFYHEKQEAWGKGVEVFRMAVLRFGAAVEGSNDQELLDAAENLHAKYEDLAFILHPSPKPVENFHRVLYVVYHDYLPNKNYEKLKEASAELKNRADSIVTIPLRPYFAEYKTKYIKAAKELQKKCAALVKACKGRDKKAIEKAVEAMHSSYQKLDEIFKE